MIKIWKESKIFFKNLWRKLDSQKGAWLLVSRGSLIVNVDVGG